MEREMECYSDSEIERLFKGAISEKAYEILLEDGRSIPKGCEERIATIMFLDCVGFNAFMRETPPDLAFQQLTALHDILLDTIRENEGYINLFVGDAMLVVFGAPIAVDEKTQAERACKAAIEALSGHYPGGLSIGAGINTGTVYFGSSTSSGLPSYDVLGDVVNDASRFEGQSRRSGQRLMLGSRTKDLIKDRYRAVFHDWLPSNGKQGADPIPVFAIVGELAAMEDPERRFWDRYDIAAAELQSGNAKKAIELFQELADERKSDILLSTQVERARRAYASSLAELFNKASDLDGLTTLLIDACSCLVPQAKSGIIEAAPDGLWRFKESPSLSGNPMLMAPSGDSMIWLRGLPGTAATTDAPEPLASAGFDLVVPIRCRNELAAAILLGTSAPAKADKAALDILAKALAEPWADLKAQWLRERYREKIDDATKLEEVNRELECKSIQLERALAEIRTFSASLEKKVREHAERLERASSLKRYLPPAVVEDIIEGKRDLSPRTERRKITVLFSDVRGFTSATDGLEPEELSRLLNEYLSSMSAIAFSHRATIDKFRGDGMMVFFGAPEVLPPAEGARRCLRMAVEMSREIERLRAAWFREGYDWDLGVRMGVNTGYATVGEFGCTDRLDYTAIGTEVNLAARLEGACETDSIVVSHATWALINEEFPCSPLGDVSLKGIHRPVKIYSVDWRSIRTGCGDASQ